MKSIVGVVDYFVACRSGLNSMAAIILSNTFSKRCAPFSHFEDVSNNFLDGEQ